jgi:hypothetical protein
MGKTYRTTSVLANAQGVGDSRLVRAMRDRASPAAEGQRRDLAGSRVKLSGEDSLTRHVN